MSTGFLSLPILKTGESHLNTLFSTSFLPRSLHLTFPKSPCPSLTSNSDAQPWADVSLSSPGFEEAWSLSTRTSLPLAFSLSASFLSDSSSSYCSMGLPSMSEPTTFPISAICTTLSPLSIVSCSCIFVFSSCICCPYLFLGYYSRLKPDRKNKEIQVYNNLFL